MNLLLNALFAFSSIPIVINTIKKSSRNHKTNTAIPPF
jgi:hypothetical protein